MSNELHPFERAGLGKAPFRYVGMVAQDRCYGEVILNRAEFQATGIAVTTKPGGSCAYCGTYILNMYNVRSADGRVFHVGSDCVEKAGDKKLVAAVKVETRKAAKVRREAKAEAVKAELAALLDVGFGRRYALMVIAHPTKTGLTMLDYADWMLHNGGATGRAKVLKAVKAALEGK